MLRNLFVKNFAIINELEISFAKGLTIISGETGAGKSILVGAVNLILGSRASQELIRTGASEALVEATLTGSQNTLLHKRLTALELEAADEVTIRRSINRNGRNRIFINDQQISLQQLQELLKGCITISGQHEHQMLMDISTHLALLDAFGDLTASRKEIERLYGGWAKARQQLVDINRLKEQQTAKMEMIHAQLEELSAAKLTPGEEIVLEQEKKILKNAGTLVSIAQSCHHVLYAQRDSVLEQLAGMEKDLISLAQIDPSQSSLLSQLQDARIQLQELAYTLQQYAHSISFDPDRFQQIEDRLALLHKLKRKYGGTIDELIQRTEELRNNLAQMEDTDLLRLELERTVQNTYASYLESATVLSSRRRLAAKKLKEHVEGTLSLLDMSKARFEVNFSDTPETKELGEDRLTPSGIDRIEFLLSANPGEAPKPLVRVASGGELSRILLALKSILPQQGDIETSIFDEVDAGIGGRTAELVGLQLKRLAEKQQVICITHLPQIACYGHQHLKVTKETQNLQTETRVHVLSHEDRVEELARMLGGITISEKTREHAREMLHHAQGSS